jgi:hypothetical protein
MLSDEQREQFDRTGLLRLPAAPPLTEVAAMRNRFWEFLSAQHGIDKDRAGTWTVERPPHLQALKRSGVFAPMGGTTVRQALDDLLGPGIMAGTEHLGIAAGELPGSGRALERALGGLARGLLRPRP